MSKSVMLATLGQIGGVGIRACSHDFRALRRRSFLRIARKESVVYWTYTSDDGRSEAQKWPCPIGLRPKSRAAALQASRMEQPFASACALQRTISESNA